MVLRKEPKKLRPPPGEPDTRINEIPGDTGIDDMPGDTGIDDMPGDTGTYDKPGDSLLDDI